MGAINKATSEYETPRIAEKKNKYKCPDCDKDVILKKGEILAHHFAHHKDTNSCTYYSGPNESQQHKTAKMVLKCLHDRGIQITVIVSCPDCHSEEDISIPQKTELSSMILEHGFNYNGSRKVADVAHLANGKIAHIFEIFYKHRTKDEDRPEPWFEFNAMDLINTVARTNMSSGINLTCIRKNTCERCVKENEILRIQRIQEEEKRKKKAIKDAEDYKKKLIKEAEEQRLKHIKYEEERIQREIEWENGREQREKDEEARRQERKQKEKEEEERRQIEINLKEELKREEKLRKAQEWEDFKERQIKKTLEVRALEEKEANHAREIRKKLAKYIAKVDSIILYENADENSIDIIVANKKKEVRNIARSEIKKCVNCKSERCKRCVSTIQDEYNRRWRLLEDSA